MMQVIQSDFTIVSQPIYFDVNNQNIVGLEGEILEYQQSWHGVGYIKANLFTEKFDYPIWIPSDCCSIKERNKYLRKVRESHR